MADFALSFGGNLNNVDLGSSASLKSSVVSIFGRVKPSGSGNRTIFGYVTAGLQLRINSSNQLELLKIGIASIGTSTGTLTNGTTYSIGVTYDASGNYAFYINGVLSGSGTNLQAITFTGNARLGDKQSLEFYAGVLDFFHYYNTALTATNALHIHNGIEPPTASLQARYYMDEGTGTTIADSSGNGNTGTLGGTNTPTWVAGITPTAPTVALTGTITSLTQASDIVAGGKTIILTVTGDTWVASGATFDAQRQNIINGMVSAQSEAHGWNNEVKAKIGVSDVVRTSNTVVTITLDAESAYAITAPDVITLTVPATALILGAALVASPIFTININSVFRIFGDEGMVA